tara:strand:+ start:434 stop:625 length:192 start_codon:yes stop_codon:yes gene_type:complete
MDYLLTEGKAEKIQEKLQKIGELSLLIIKGQEHFSKDDLWERAVLINKLGQEVHKDISRLSRT